MVGVRKNSKRSDDFHPSPPLAGTKLIEAEPFDGGIWECACGDGALSRVFEAAGHKVVSTDLVNRGFGQGRIDFLMERTLLAPNVVTNPPFKLAKEFVLHALDIGAVKVAMLLRIHFLETPKRVAMFRSTPFRGVLVFADRLPMMHGEGYDGVKLDKGLICFAWFLWERGYAGAPTIGWI